MTIKDVDAILSKIKPPKKRCDTLWALNIKAMAGFICEYSGEHGTQIGGDKTLNAHHIIGKPNFTLRYSFDNGVCLTSGIHFFVAHHSARREGFMEWIGKARLKRLDKLRNVTTKANYKEKEKELYNNLQKLLKN